MFAYLNLLKQIITELFCQREKDLTAFFRLNMMVNILIII